MALITKLKLKCDLCPHRIDVPDDKLPDGWGYVEGSEYNGNARGPLVRGLINPAVVCLHCLKDIKNVLLKRMDSKRD